MQWLSFEIKKSLLVYHNKKAFDLYKYFELTIQMQLLINLRNKVNSVVIKKTISFQARIQITSLFESPQQGLNWQLKLQAKFQIATQ